jgi:membrane fusion protein (multidrug efflux system)
LARWRRHYWTLVASHHVSTDNAYVAVEMAQITPEVSGTVREVLAVDTQSVKRGDILARWTTAMPS